MLPHPEALSYCCTPTASSSGPILILLVTGSKARRLLPTPAPHPGPATGHCAGTAPTCQISVLVLGLVLVLFRVGVSASHRVGLGAGVSVGASVVFLPL